MPDKHTSTFAAQKEAFTDKMNKVEKTVRTKLILIIVANTLDPEIGAGCRQDVKSIRTMYKEMSDHMDFNFIELLVQGADYGKENILGAINLLTPGSNDIVVFYYSGHGFSYEKDASKKFAQVDLRPHPSSTKIDVVNANTENLADIFEMVKSKGARLNIVMGDCCNSVIQFKRMFPGGDDAVRNAEQPPMIINKQMVETLFCDYTASILVGAADKGQFAISDEKLGSLFTFNFTNNLKVLMNKAVDPAAPVPWSKLLEETQAKTHSLSKTYDIGNGVPGNQQPIFDIHLRQSLY